MVHVGVSLGRIRVHPLAWRYNLGALMGLGALLLELVVNSDPCIFICHQTLVYFNDRLTIPSQTSHPVSQSGRNRGLMCE